ncbi:MAG: hypothetical protein AAB466_10365 [Verrucomicrobiota bacterium]
MKVKIHRANGFTFIGIYSINLAKLKPIWLRTQQKDRESSVEKPGHIDLEPDQQAGEAHDDRSPHHRPVLDLLRAAKACKLRLWLVQTQAMARFLAVTS